MSFSSRFPRLYALDTDKSASVADKLRTREVLWSWRRPIRNGRESEEFDLLSETITGCSLSDTCDKWTWSLNSNGQFSVNSICVIIDKAFLGIGDRGTIWNTTTPPKINIFIWRVMLDRIPTRDNLLRLNVELDSVLCPLCGAVNETTQHILFECPVSLEAWKFFERWWSFSFPTRKSLESMIQGIRVTFGNNSLGQTVEGVFFSSCYVLWCFRNRLVFDHHPPNKDVMLDHLVEKSFYWVLARCKGGVGKI